MPFLSEAEALARINSGDNLLNDDKPAQIIADLVDAPLDPDSIQDINQVEIENHNRHGRTKGTSNIPAIMQGVIGITAAISGPTEAAKEFGIAPSTAHGYSIGKIGGSAPSNREDTKLKSLVEQKQEQAVEKAMDKVLASIGLLDDDRIKNAKARDIAGIAKDMASIVEKMSPNKNQGNLGGGVNIVIMAPTLRDESRYEVLEVNR